MTIRQMAVAQRTQEYHRATPAEIEAAHHRIEKQAVAMGYMIEGMCLHCYGDHKDDPVELSDPVVQQVKDAALASSKDGYGWNDTDYLSPIVKSYIKTVDVDKRLASSTALQKVWKDECDRIGWYIHSQDPSWTVWGQHFDTSILDGYKQGIDVKA